MTIAQKKIRVRDLRDQTGRSPKEQLYCPKCGGTYSAHASDYFNVPGDEVFMCCDTPNRLVTQSTSFKDVVR